MKSLTKSVIRSSCSWFEHCSKSLIYPLGSHIWSLLAPIQMTGWSKVSSSWSQFEHCRKLLSLVICGHCMCQFMSKVDHKWNWVKLKSVRTLLRITCLADKKSYVVIICASSFQKLTKSEIGSSWSRFEHCSESLL